MVRFPRFVGTTRGSDFRRPSRPARFPRLAVPAPLRCSLSRGPSAPSASLGVYGLPVRLRWRWQDLPGPWRSLSAFAALSDPGGTSAPHANGAPVLPAFRLTTLAPTMGSFRGSITRLPHSLCTLRSRGCPRATQHSVLGRSLAFAGQDSSCWDPLRVQSATRLPPSPGLAWRTNRLNRFGSRREGRTRGENPVLCSRTSANG